MGYAVGEGVFLGKFRWIGYGVPAYCDHPDCNVEIDRGMGYACNHECGGYYCSRHRFLPEIMLNDNNEVEYCGCLHEHVQREEHPKWLAFILNEESWEKWRKENPEVVEEYQNQLDINNRFMGKGSRVMVCCTNEDIPYDEGVGTIITDPDAKGWMQVEWPDKTVSEIHTKFLFEV